MINSLKKYLYISLGLHLFIFIVILIVSTAGNIKQPFVVFGAYSKKDYHTLYKAKRSIIPFMGHSTAKLGNGNGKSVSGKKKLVKSGSSSKNKNSKITEKSKKNKFNEKKSKAAGKSKKDKRGESKSKVSSKKKPLTEPNSKKELAEEKKIEAELKKIELDAQKEMDEEIKNEEKRASEKQKKIDKEIKEKEKREAEELKKLEEIEAKKEQEMLEVKPKQQDPEIIADPEINDSLDDSEDIDEDEIQEGASQEEFVFTLGDLGAYNRCIQSETARLWNPPLGVPKGTSCKVKFVINKDGEVEDFQTIQKSNVIIYDLSILRVAHLFKFDKCLWGKSFVIDFRQ